MALDAIALGRGDAVLNASSRQAVAEPGVLGEIAAAKRTELASRYAGMSLDALRSHARPTRVRPRRRSARPAPVSSSRSRRLRPRPARSGPMPMQAELARLCRRGRCPERLSDSAFFGGSLRDLAAARAEFDGPILAKDFFVDLRQVAEARIAGADAMLVMLALLDDASARQMIVEARRFGMDALVEVHDEREMRRALEIGARLIGINNRDLRDLSVDLSTTERLAALPRLLSRFQIRHIGAR